MTPLAPGSADAPGLHVPALHRVNRTGWINDPNGIIRLADRWHVFFQYNPFSARHDRIRWGHVSSPDLVTWREEPLGPEPRAGQADAGGCWSGVAAMLDGAPCLLYSGVDGTDNAFSRVMLQRGSADLTTFEPAPRPVADLPEVDGLAGVRDPFLLELDGRPLAIQGAELRRTGPGGHPEVVPAILAWDRSDIENWRYLGPVLLGDHPLAREHTPADLWECPQLVPLRDRATGEERWLLSLGRWCGPTPTADASLNGVGYLLGSLTWDDTAPVDASDRLGPLRFTPEAGGDVDLGPDFYAPQAVLDGDRVLLWGWSWEGAARTQEQTDAQGWAGCLTFPRELVLADGRLSACTPRELEALRGRRFDLSPAETGDEPDRAELVLPYPARAEIRAGGPVRLEVLAADGTVRETMLDTRSLPRAGGGDTSEPATGRLPQATGVTTDPVTVLLDASIAEVLPEVGEPWTGRLYPEAGESLRVTGTLSAAWELHVPDGGTTQPA